MGDNKENKEYLQYKEYIKKLALKNENAVFYNSGPKHAALVMGTIFSNAKNYVKIYAGGFTGQVSKNEEYREGLEKFLRDGGKLEVLLQNDKYKANEKPEIFDILRFYKKINPNQVSVKVHSHKVVKEKDDEEVHFTVADDKMYRVEDDIVKFTASGNFNDSEKSKGMSKLFDDIFREADEITLM